MADNLPIYIQIHDQIKSKIESGFWKIKCLLFRARLVFAVWCQSDDFATSDSNLGRRGNFGA